MHIPITAITNFTAFIFNIMAVVVVVILILAIIVVNGNATATAAIEFLVNAYIKIFESKEKATQNFSQIFTKHTENYKTSIKIKWQEIIIVF